MKKDLLIIGWVCLFSGFFFTFSLDYINDYSFEVFANNGIKLGKTSSVDEIYSRDWNEGTDFYVFYYDRDKDIKKIIDKNGYTKITKDNVDDVTKHLEIYYNDLQGDNIEKFNKTTSISELTSIGNYYLRSENEEDFDERDENYFIEIIFPKEKKNYHFHVNY